MSPRPLCDGVATEISVSRLHTLSSWLVAFVLIMWCFPQLIQQAYAPQNHLSSEDQRRLQQELFEIQRRPEAWGLVLPFLNNPDANVQFFGAHTLQVKIARDW